MQDIETPAAAAPSATVEPTAHAPASAGQDTLEFLLRRMRLKSDFPALSESIQRINEISRSDRERIDSVSSAILQDFSLTNKILRMVNSSYYRGAHQEPVSTMSRAIMVLGFEAIRSLAVSLTLFEHMTDKARAAKLREEFVRASLRAAIARSLAHHGSRAGEEAHLAAMFHRLGRLLALYYFPEEFDEIERQVNACGATEDAATRRVLGIDFEALGVGVARGWGFPPALQQSMQVLDPDAQVPAVASHEMNLRVIANFSAELTDLMERHEGAKLAAGIDALSHRYGKSLGVTTPQIRARSEHAIEQIREMSKVLGLHLEKMPLGRRLLSLERGQGSAEEASRRPSAGNVASRSHEASRGDEAAGGDEASRGRAPSGDTPLQDGTAAPAASGLSPDPAPDTVPAPGADTGAPRRQEILANGLVDLSRTLAEQSALNDIVRMAIETLYRGMALQRVLFALRDARTNSLVGRLGFGPGMPELAKSFRIPLDAPGDLFAATANKGADLLIHDSGADNIVARIPAWYREHFGAGSFILLPLALRAMPVGLIYADQPGANQITIGEQELSLVRAIRNQVVLAFRQARTG
ncbi:MAG: HDOD domain-containing protein [Burkholderiaceae bacterium]